MKKFLDIEHAKPKHFAGFGPGDHIIIQEKIDGANFSIRYDAETDSVACFSRKRQLDAKNGLRGAYEFVQTIDRHKVKEVLGDNLILFGEWLVPHTIKYPQEAYNRTYFYDVYDVDKHGYLEQDKVRDVIDRLGFEYAHVFYDGEFVSWSHIKQFVGATAMGGEIGEGIVIKNMSRLNDPDSKNPFYIKMVVEKMSELKRQKAKMRTDVQEYDEQIGLVETVVTPARVAKLINNLIDEGIIPVEWDEHDMGIIAKNIGKMVYQDCIKEEPDIVESVGNMFGKISNRIAMRIVRETLLVGDKL